MISRQHSLAVGRSLRAPFGLPREGSWPNRPRTDHILARREAAVDPSRRRRASYSTGLGSMPGTRGASGNHLTEADHELPGIDRPDRPKVVYGGPPTSSTGDKP